MSLAIRFRFSRDASLQYIAHLDMLRLFERTLRRTGLPVSHTGGFNPRMKLVFGLPLATGFSSIAEVADIFMDVPVTPEVFIASMNTSLPPGVSVLGASVVSEKDNVMLRVAAARYQVTYETKEHLEAGGMEPLLQRMLTAEKVPVLKKGKKGMQEVDIRPWIYAASTSRTENDHWQMEMFLSAGAHNNLRPDLLMGAWTRMTGVEFIIRTIFRTALYASVDNTWVDLLDPLACDGRGA